MYSRWYTPTVVLLWLCTMAWLVSQKIVPSMLLGDPPNQHAILEARGRERAVGWEMSFAARPLGWAVTSTDPRPDGTADLRAAVHFDELPVAEFTPGWMQTLFKLADQPDLKLSMDARSKVVLDPGGRVSRFRSVVHLIPLGDTIELEGTIEGTRLNLLARSGDFSYTTQIHLPADALLGDSLSPQTQLPGLHLGQTWTAPSYSPLRPPNSPVEILRATVEREVKFSWAGHTHEAWLVTYRAESGLSFFDHSRPQAKLWVRRDGTVLQQEISLLESPLRFTRMSPERSRKLLESLPARPGRSNWNRPHPVPSGQSAP